MCMPMIQKWIILSLEMLEAFSLSNCDLKEYSYSS